MSIDEARQDSGNWIPRQPQWRRVSKASARWENEKRGIRFSALTQLTVTQAILCRIAWSCTCLAPSYWHERSCDFLLFFSLLSRFPLRRTLSTEGINFSCIYLHISFHPIPCFFESTAFSFMTSILTQVSSLQFCSAFGSFRINWFLIANAIQVQILNILDSETNAYTYNAYNVVHKASLKKITIERTARAKSLDFTFYNIMPHVHALLGSLDSPYLIYLRVRDKRASLSEHMSLQ